ncbi:hypothetical protein GCM10009856_21370 [Mycolicibacterium llatzerense]
MSNWASFCRSVRVLSRACGSHGGAVGAGASIGLLDAAVLLAWLDVLEAAGWSDDDEQPATNPDTSASAPRVRGKDMGTEPSRATAAPGSRDDLVAGWRTRKRAGRHASLGAMDRFLVPAGASIVVGLLLGAAAVFGTTLMLEQDTKPTLQSGDPASSVLNRVEYGNRS